MDVNTVHHKLKPSFCTLCDESFADEGKLDKHIDAVHNRMKAGKTDCPTQQCDNSELKTKWKSQAEMKANREAASDRIFGEIETELPIPHVR